MPFKVERHIFTYDEASLIWDILKDECGASEVWRDAFTHWVVDQRMVGQEFRFQGDLGFGGKVWFYLDKIYVNCYREDETPERLAMMSHANLRLDHFVQDLPDAVSL
jgi:hypothetical protein